MGEDEATQALVSLEQGVRTQTWAGSGIPTRVGKKVPAAEEREALLEQQSTEEDTETEDGPSSFSHQTPTSPEA